MMGLTKKKPRLEDWTGGYREQWVVSRAPD
jgi:hypothetical protein